MSQNRGFLRAGALSGGTPAGDRREAGVLNAVLFDFDGTLTLPGHLDFAEIRAAIGCPPGESLLGYLASIEEPSSRLRAEEILDEFETRAADRSQEDPDAARVVRYCRDRGLRLAIITRNSRKSIERSLGHFPDLSADDFDTLITRDDPVSVKPEPDGVLLACSRLGVEPANALLVGDYLYDIEAGKRAGTTTVFYDSDPRRSFERPASDHTIARLGDLLLVLRLYEPLPPGKVPNELLEQFLTSPVSSEAREGARRDDAAAKNAEALLVGPSVGEDVAVIDSASVQASPDDPELLLLKSDPITFVAEDFGHYLLTVNANDISTAGGTPRWLLATLLVPPGTLGIEIGRLFSDLREGCARAGVVLCGGHTELTDAVTRPVVSGTMAGTVAANRLIRKDSMKEGDRVVLTKGIAVEGTAILAASHGEELRRHGLSPRLIERAADLRERMSVRTEAAIASTYRGVTAMHDVTEGGVATALRELARAGRHRLRVDAGSIPLLPETVEICRMLGLDPLGLIGSGSLLICVSAADCGPLTRAVASAGIDATVIGEVLESGEGIEAVRDGKPWNLPDFVTDELARLQDSEPSDPQ